MGNAEDFTKQFMDDMFGGGVGKGTMPQPMAQPQPPIQQQQQLFRPQVLFVRYVLLIFSTRSLLKRNLCFDVYKT